MIAPSNKSDSLLNRTSLPDMLQSKLKELYGLSLVVLKQVLGLKGGFSYDGMDNSKIRCYGMIDRLVCEKLRED